jgi:predicted dehydrogenase
MNKPITRRSFLQTNLTLALAAGAFPSIIPASALGREGKIAPSSRIGVALIGCGPQGRGDMNGALAQADARVIAVCDVWGEHAEQACKQVNDHYQDQACRPYADYRELLARSDIDAVIVGTPDHWHVPVSIAAVNAGKDVYLEKPMGLTLAEDKLLRKAVLKKKRIFQFGTQQRSGREFQRAVELVRSGCIGKLEAIYVWAPASQPGGATNPVTAPATLNYDFWLGPAPATLYTPNKAEASGGKDKTWWYNSDYALGFVAGWGIHPLDIALWGHPGMFGGPMTVEGKAIFPKSGACNTSIAWDVNFSFADGVRLHFRGSPNQFNEPTPLTDFSEWQARFGLKDLHGHGTLFLGSEGWVEVHRGGMRAGPEKLGEEPLPAGGWRSPQSSQHQRNFLECVRSRKPAICPIEDSVQGDTLCHVSDIATRLGRKLTFDPRTEKFLRDDEANRRLELKPMRAPYNKWS